MLAKDMLQGHVTIASWTEAVGRIVKQRFEDGSQQTPKHLLSDPIPHRRDSQCELHMVQGRFWDGPSLPIPFIPFEASSFGCSKRVTAAAGPR